MINNVTFPNQWIIRVIHTGFSWASTQHKLSKGLMLCLGLLSHTPLLGDDGKEQNERLETERREGGTERESNNGVEGTSVSKYEGASDPTMSNIACELVR